VLASGSYQEQMMP